MKRILALTEFLFGSGVRHRVFEPLIADWQREWRSAASASARLRIGISGSTAVLIAVVACLLTARLAVGRAAVTKGLLTVALSSIALLALQLGLMSRQSTIDWIFELRVWMALPRMLPFVVPLAILSTMMLWQGLGLGTRAAVLNIAAAGALAVCVTGWLVPKTQGEPPFSDRWQEAMYQRLVESSPAAANSALRRSTPERRAAARQKQRTNPRYIAFQTEQTRPRWNTRAFSFGGLTVALGILGWALGGIGRTRPIHAAAWWTLTCVALMLFDGQFRFWINNNTGLVAINRAPGWAALVVFGTAAILMLFARRSTDVSRTRIHSDDGDARHHGFHTTNS